MKKLILSLVLLLLFPISASAESGFSVSPVILELNKVGDYNILVANRESKQLNLSYRVVELDLTSSGSVNKVGETTLPNYIEVKGFDEHNEIEINPRSSTSIYINYNKVNEPVEKLIGIELVSRHLELQENRTESTIQSSIVVPILILDYNHQSRIEVAEFKTTTFTFANNAEFDIKIINQGNTLVKTEAKLKIKNLIGKTVETFDLGPKYILGSQTRALKQNDNNPIWSPGLLIGLYSADLEVASNGQNIVKTKLIMGIPAKQTLISVILLIFLVGIYLRVKKYR